MLRLNVTHLRHVALVAPEFERSNAFFADAWGLECVAREGGRSFFRTARAEPYQLELLAGPRRAIDHIALGLPAKADVDAAAAALAAAGVEVTVAPAALTGPGGGYGLRFRDPDGRTIELSAEVRCRPRKPRSQRPHFSRTSC